MIAATWFGRRARVAQASPRDFLTPLQTGWLGALLIAAQLPQAPHLPISVAVAGLMLVVVRIFILRRDRMRPQAAPGRIPSWALALFAVAAAVGIRHSFGYFVGRDPSVAFLFILVAIKYLETRTRRDGVILVCLACFLLMTPFFYSQSIFAALAALPAVLLVGVALDVLNSQSGGLPRAFTPTSALRRSAVMIAQGLPIAILLFVLFPRLASPLWGLPSDTMARSGLSDSMSPGDIRDLSLSDEVAFRVEFEGEAPPQRELYWRGPVFAHFDGRTWSPLPSSYTGEVAEGSGREVSYTVTLEPTQRRSLFALELPASVPVVQSESTTRVPLRPRLTNDQQLLLMGPTAQVLRYEQRSLLRSTYPARAFEARTHLGLGQGNPRTIELARELREKAADDRAYIRAILGRFRNEPFAYTLTPPLLEQRNPIDQFLFDTRRGFCEHYASAFVILMRAAGIPARVVTGYQGGTMNAVRGGYMIVRQSDAHAWAEALVDGNWVRVDPTAAVSPSRIEIGLGGAFPAGEGVPFLARLNGTWFTDVQLAWDAFNYSWRRNVIGFDRARQRSVWQDLKLDVLPAWQVVGLIGLFLLAWGVIVVGWLMYKRRHQERALVLWDDLNRRLARAGLPREPHEGPLAFSGRAAARWPQFAIAFAAIGESFAELRYGAVTVARERDALVATLERAIEVLPAPAALRATA